jgi:GAF domain-containing protein
VSSVPDLVPALRQWTRSEKDTRQFSLRALHTLVGELSPLATAATTLRVTYGGLLLRNSTLKDAPLGTIIKTEALSVYTRVMAERQARIDHERRVIVQPLFFADSLELLLEIQVAAAYPLEEQADEALHLTNSAAEQFALLLENQQALHLIQQLAQTSADLKTCATYQDIASVLGANLLEVNQFVTLNFFDHDAAGKVTGFRTIASASRHRAFDTGASFAFTSSEDLDLYGRMVRGDDAYVADVATDPRLSPALRAQLQEWKIKSFYLLPLQFGERLHGFITVNDTASPVLLMPVEKQTFTSVAGQVSAAIENQQYRAEVQQSASASRRQIRVLGQLNDLAISSGGETDETGLLQKAAPVLVEVTGADRCGILLIDPDGLMGTIAAVYPQDNNVTGLKIDLAQHTVVQTLLTSGEPLLVMDVNTSDAITPATRETLLSTGVQGALFLPLFDLNRNLMGSVGLDYFAPLTEFEPELVDIARTFAGQIGVSLQKLRLLESSRRQVEQMQRMTTFSQAVQSTLDLHTILATILQEAPHVVALDYLSVLLYDRDAAYIRQVARLMETVPHIELPGTLLTPNIDSLAHKSWTDQETVRVDDMKETWDWQHPYRNTYRTLLSTPITSGASRRGVLQIGALRASAYSESDEAALRQMCNQIAIVLDNAEAFEHSQRIARHKALANQISARLQEQMDIEGILSTTVNELGRAVGAKHARIRLGLQADTGQNKQE